MATNSLKETKSNIVQVNKHFQKDSKKGSRFAIPESENQVELLDIELHGLPAEASV